MFFGGIYRAAFARNGSFIFAYNTVAHKKSKTCSFSLALGGKKRVEYLVNILFWYAMTIVTNYYNYFFKISI